MEKRYNRVFVPNPSFKFNPEILYELAETVVYTCDTPVFDHYLDESFSPQFEGRVAERLDDFDPEKDVIAHYGDVIIFSMMVMYLSDNHDHFDIARFSNRQQKYIVRNLSFERFYDDEKEESPA